MTTTALDVVRYIKSKQDVSGEVQAQKLVYYAQAWSLTWTGRPLFDDVIEAWQMGPVVRSIRYMVEQVAPDQTRLSVAQARIVDAVLAKYGALWGTQLTVKTHAEAPWSETYKNREDKTTARCSDEIAHDAMRRYYSQIASDADAPEPQNDVVAPAVEDVLAIARANAVRWRGALDLLAR